MTCNGMTSTFFPAGFSLQMRPAEEGQDHSGPTTSVAVAPLLLSSNLTYTKPDAFKGVTTNFLGKRSMPSEGCDLEVVKNGEEDLTSDDCSHLGEKKRRLNMEQVKTLEKNFEVGNKLEPERKMQLARALGLQPRQIAIWFQNRRARWKTKQLEKDYEVLKKQFEIVKSSNDLLHAKNKELQQQIRTIIGCRKETSEPMINLNKETEGSCSNRSENSSDIKIDMSRSPATDNPSNCNWNDRSLIFQTSSSMKSPSPAAASIVTKFLHSSSPMAGLQQCPKIDLGVQDENFGNMFGCFDDQPGFWTVWQDQHNFQ